MQEQKIALWQQLPLWYHVILSYRICSGRLYPSSYPVHGLSREDPMLPSLNEPSGGTARRTKNHKLKPEL